MTKQEYLKCIQELEGEALFRQTMHWLSIEEIADSDLEFTVGPMQNAAPELTLNFLDEEGEDNGDRVVLTLAGSVVGVTGN